MTKNKDQKFHLKAQIRHYLFTNGISQRQVASKLNVHPPRVSQILSGNASGGSYDQLFRLLNALGVNFTIVVGEAK